MRQQRLVCLNPFARLSCLPDKLRVPGCEIMLARDVPERAADIGCRNGWNDLSNRQSRVTATGGFPQCPSPEATSACIRHMCSPAHKIWALVSLMFGTRSQKRVRSRFPHIDRSPPSFFRSVEIGPLFTSDVLDQRLQCCQRYEKRWLTTWKIKIGPLVNGSSSGVGTLSRFL